MHRKPAGSAATAHAGVTRPSCATSADANFRRGGARCRAARSRQPSAVRGRTAHQPGRARLVGRLAGLLTAALALAILTTACATAGSGGGGLAGPSGGNSGGGAAGSGSGSGSQAGSAGGSAADVTADQAPADTNVGFVGNIWPNDVQRDPAFTTFWDQVTPENGGKWGQVEGSRDQMQWGNLDAAWEFAQENEIPFRYHTLFWGRQQPSWIADLPPEEQLEEIHEWLDALAERYPSPNHIDVVNEPLHAQPSYKEALGGDGETGWDWIVTAFELAREHFPEAELHINDYNIITTMDDAGGEQNNLERYLEIVRILQERDLIDGIGMQSHSLEQTDTARITEKLDRLAETGLPLYATELEVNLTDDFRQAHRMRELVTTFYEHPAVAGITLWGYREGLIWRQNAYLLGEDGTPRPALSWLQCYIARGSCRLPAYTPQPRIGDGTKVRLEVEEWDQTQGFHPGGTTAYAVGTGDWARYDKTVLDSSFNTVKIAYASSSGTDGRIEFRLDGDSGEPHLSVPLPATGGGSTYKTVEAEWPAVDGVHDIHISFPAEGWSSNFDFIEIGHLASVGTVGETILQAENADEHEGVEVYGDFIGYVDGGDWLLFSGVEIPQGYTEAEFVYGRGGDNDAGGVELRLGSRDGPLIASAQPSVTGGWNTFESVYSDLEADPGTYDIYVLFTGPSNLGNFERFVLRAGQ